MKQDKQKQTIPKSSQLKNINVKSDINLDRKDIEELGTRIISDSFEGSEIIIGLVEAVGTDSNQVITQITNGLRPYNYDVEVISISRDVIPSIINIKPTRYKKEANRIKKMMDAGDQARELFKDNSILSYGATMLINLKRKSIKEKKYNERNWPGYAKQTAYIIKSLKRPEEVELLRRVYGSGFYLIGIYTDENRRIDLLEGKGVSKETAKELSKRDSNCLAKFGQKASDTYHLADFFLHYGDSTDDLKARVERTIKLLFGNPHLTPLFDEFAMFMAFAASLRSADLARQVGAVVTRDNEIIATGANDSPRKDGGLYWTKYDKEKKEFARENTNGTDFDRGYDSNSKELSNMINEVILALSKKGYNREIVEEVLKKSRIVDITEHGRSVHAEMEALMQCARNSNNTKGATLYCTTFPCHNCAKHIVASGIKRVVYIEPYPKSKALELHDDSISNILEDSPEKVIFEPFEGVGPRRFFDLFSMNLGLGSHLTRKDKKGIAEKWIEKHAEPRIRLSPLATLDHEKGANEYYYKKIEEIETRIGKKLKKVRQKEVIELLKRDKNGKEKNKR